MAIKHTYKGKHGFETSNLTPIRAIRKFCFQCYGWCDNYVAEVKNCPATDCALWPFRTGKTGLTGKAPKNGAKALVEWRAKMHESKAKAYVRAPKTGDLPPTHT